MIDARTLMGGTVDAATDPAHPALLLEIPAAARRRATLGDLVPALNDYVVSMVEVTANEMDITGAVPVEPPVVATPVYASAAELKSVLGIPADRSDDRVDLALVAASRWVDFRIGVASTNDPITLPLTLGVVPSTAAIHDATVAAAVRFYKSADVPFGVAGQDMAVYVRTGMPDVELLLLGHRQTFGVA
jgi:hypothetical protein